MKRTSILCFLLALFVLSACGKTEEEMLRFSDLVENGSGKIRLTMHFSDSVGQVFAEVLDRNGYIQNPDEPAPYRFAVLENGGKLVWEEQDSAPDAVCYVSVLIARKASAEKMNQLRSMTEPEAVKLAEDLGVTDAAEHGELVWNAVRGVAERRCFYTPYGLSDNERITEEVVRAVNLYLLDSPVKAYTLCLQKDASGKWKYALVE